MQPVSPSVATEVEDGQERDRIHLRVESWVIEPQSPIAPAVGYAYLFVGLLSGGKHGGLPGLDDNVSVRTTTLFSLGTKIKRPPHHLTMKKYLSCLFALSIAVLSVQGDWSSCTYTDLSGNEIDLSAYKTAVDKVVTFTGLEDDPTAAETWYFNLCQPLQQPPVLDGGCTTSAEDIAAGPVSVCQTWQDLYSSYVMGSLPEGALGPDFVASTIEDGVVDVQGLQGPSNINGRSAQAIILHLKCGAVNEIVNATALFKSTSWTFTWTDPSLCDIAPARFSHKCRGPRCRHR
ncbi:hypothetical protein PROFUN_01162 [Planoprotostelium fungivorum]|uniref:Uncharacterized protein n=1 Tax=Planoprotostelium fungivorum TaxID=1890364 RepID=A0A2P6NCI9_9EUKA|nr:hypothetical protein PROFUN_01162 [Planoprotostelium fungivorum]